MAKRLHQVRAGETLKSLALGVLGEEDRWQEIAYINSLSYPYMLKPGELILIPENGAPLEVVITKGQPPPVSAANEPSPAEWAALAVGAVLIYMAWSR